MKCHCSANREKLALLVGQAEPVDFPEPLRRSLTNCPNCREHYQQLLVAHAAIDHCVRSETVTLSRSLWPELAPRLARQQVRRNRYEWFQRQFVPAFSMTAACLAVLIVLWESGPANRRVYQTTATYGNSQFASPVVPVGNSADFSAGFPRQSAFMPSELSSTASRRMFDTQLPGDSELTPGEQRLRSIQAVFQDSLRSQFERDLEEFRP